MTRPGANSSSVATDIAERLGIDRLAPADGAFYVYADVRHLTSDSMALCHELLSTTGVATAPGIDFDTVDGRHMLRMSFAGSSDEITVALDRLETWLAHRSGPRP